MNNTERRQRLAELKRDYAWAEGEYDVCLSRAEALKAFQGRLNQAIEELEEACAVKSSPPPHR
jgi:broad specificity phosphatase PhoE